MLFLSKCITGFASSSLVTATRDAALRATRGLRRASAAQARAAQEQLNDELLPKASGNA
jgi:hypothetical protein